MIVRKIINFFKRYKGKYNRWRFRSFAKKLNTMILKYKELEVMAGFSRHERHRVRRLLFDKFQKTLDQYISERR